MTEVLDTFEAVSAGKGLSDRIFRPARTFRAPPKETVAHLHHRHLFEGDTGGFHGGPGHESLKTTIIKNQKINNNVK